MRGRAAEAESSSGPDLVLGPLLRYVGEHEATVWVETDAPCEVDVLGHSARTFTIAGHHYAIVVIEGLECGESYEYEVALDGRRRWPAEDSEFPASRITPVDPEAPLGVVFGSCRVSLPHHPPYSLSKDEHPIGAERDALYVLALELKRRAPEEWPSLLMLLGDQVYVDEGSPGARAFIRGRRDTSQEP